jgi:non-homologous end joining protein Ku
MEREYIVWTSEYSDSGFFCYSEGRHTSFSRLYDKGHKIKYKKWCPIEEREVPWSEIKKGYEISKNDYVVIEKDDLDRIKIF